MTGDSQYDDFMEKLREGGEVHAAIGDYAAVFTRLGLPFPERPKVFLDTLEAAGDLDVTTENDDATANERMIGKKRCLAYRPAPRLAK